VCVCVFGSVIIPISIERVSAVHARTLHCVYLQFDSIFSTGSNLLLFFEHIFDEGSEQVNKNNSKSIKCNITKQFYIIKNNTISYFIRAIKLQFLLIY
jgi:hypothetical protein